MFEPGVTAPNKRDENKPVHLERAAENTEWYQTHHIRRKATLSFHRTNGGFLKKQILMNVCSFISACILETDRYKQILVVPPGFVYIILIFWLPTVILCFYSCLDCSLLLHQRSHCLNSTMQDRWHVCLQCLCSESYTTWSVDKWDRFSWNVVMKWWRQQQCNTLSQCDQNTSLVITLMKWPGWNNIGCL